MFLIEKQCLYNNYKGVYNKMKKVLPFAGLIAFVLALVAFILLMATPGIVATNGDGAVKGTIAIFGGNEKIWGALAIEYKGSVLALIGWILLLVGLLAACAGAIGGLLKVKALQNLGTVFALVAAGCFLVAGIFFFLVVPTWYAANDLNVPDNVAIGAGWVVAAILTLVAAAAAALPVILRLLGKK